MDAQIASEVEILNSRDLILQTLHTKVPNKSDPTNPVELSHLLYQDIVESPPSNMSPDEAAVKAFTNDYTVAQIKLSNVITLDYQNESREYAQLALQVLLDNYTERHVGAFKSGNASLLQKQINDLEHRMMLLSQERAAFRGKSDVYSGQDQRTQLIMRREKVNQDLMDAQKDQVELASQIAFLKDELRAQPATVNIGADYEPAQASQDAMSRVTELREKESQLLSLYQPDSPLVKENELALRAAEKSLKVDAAPVELPHVGPNPVHDQVAEQLATAMGAQAPLAARIAALTQQSTDIGNELRNLESAQVTLDALDQQILDLQDESKSLRDNLENARVNDRLDSAGVTSVSVIEQPYAPQKPTKPVKIYFLIVGIALGLFGALGVLLSSMSFRTSFVTVETIERVLDLPVLAALPTSPALERRGSRNILPAPAE
jgi:uncharacterized protein involved in exopolysaccharide biosynthesis